MNFKDLYHLKKPLKDKFSKPITGNTPIVDIPELEFGLNGWRYKDPHEKEEKEEKEEGFNIIKYDKEHGTLNGYTTAELFCCKDNNYLEDEEVIYRFINDSDSDSDYDYD